MRSNQEHVTAVFVRLKRRLLAAGEQDSVKPYNSSGYLYKPPPRSDDQYKLGENRLQQHYYCENFIVSHDELLVSLLRLHNVLLSSSQLPTRPTAKSSS